MTPANRVPATMAPVTAPPTVPNWEAQLLDRAPLVLAFAVCVSFFSSNCNVQIFHFMNFVDENKLTYLHICLELFDFGINMRSRQHLIFLSNRFD